MTDAERQRRRRAKLRKSKPVKNGLTGRDRHIVIKALAYAIAAIDALPPERRALSDQRGMKAMLEQLVESDEELLWLLSNVKQQLADA